MLYRKIKKKVIFLSILLTFFNISCDETVPIPQVPVDFTINLSDPQFRNLGAVGNVVTVTGGSRGIVIKRTDLETFTAFDQHCPYDPKVDSARVSLEEGSTDFVICASCFTRYNLYFGNVEEGPGTYPLQSYKTLFYPNANVLRVYNNL